MTEEEIRASLSDVEALALTLWGEARGEAVEGQIAVACVVRNRAAAGGQAIKDVCLARRQCSCWNRDGGANHAALLDLAARVVEADHALRATATDAIFQQCRWIAEGVASWACLDRTSRATHYLTRALLESERAPDWARAMTITARIGNHVFGRA